MEIKYHSWKTEYFFFFFLFYSSLSFHYSRADFKYKWHCTKYGRARGKALKKIILWKTVWMNQASPSVPNLDATSHPSIFQQPP